MINGNKLQAMMFNLASRGDFLIGSDDRADIYLDLLLPGYKFLGEIQKILGYQPENYHLLDAYQFEDRIILSRDASNQWTGYGLLDESKEEDAKFAAEIREGAARLTALSALPFDEEGSLNDMHDPIHWVNHTILDSMKKSLAEEGFFILETSIESRDLIYSIAGESLYHPECKILETAELGSFDVIDIGDRKLKYQLISSDSAKEMAAIKINAEYKAPASNQDTPYDFMDPAYVEFQANHPKHKLNRIKVLEAQLEYAREGQFVIPLDTYMEVYLEEILPQWVHLGHVNDIVGFNYYSKDEVFYHVYFYEGALVMSFNCMDIKTIMFRKLENKDMVLRTLQEKIAKRLFTAYAPS